MNAIRYFTKDLPRGATTRKLPHALSLACFLVFSLLLSQSSFAQIDKSTPILFNTVVTSFDFSGSGSLPLGPEGEYIETQVGGTRATDHNSSRSNKTSSIAAPPDDIDPNDLDGETFELFSTLNIEFDLSFSTNDVMGFAPELGDIPTAETISNAELALDPGAVFVFERSAPDFGMLRAGGPPKRKYRGHVTVLKIAFGGGGGDIDLAAEGLELSFEPGTDKYTHLANGNVRHEVGFTLDITGTYSNPPSSPNSIVVEQPFSLLGLTGTMIEEGQLVNNIVPEPSAVLLALAGLALTTLKCRR